MCCRGEDRENKEVVDGGCVRGMERWKRTREARRERGSERGKRRRERGRIEVER